jgi:hypothetical protein
MICDAVDTKNTYKKQGNIINRENKCQNGMDMPSGKKTPGNNQGARPRDMIEKRTPEPRRKLADLGTMIIIWSSINSALACKLLHGKTSR